MDDAEGDGRFPSKFDTSNYQSSFRSTIGTKYAFRDVSSYDPSKRRFAEVENDGYDDQDVVDMDEAEEEDEFKEDDDYGSDDEYNPYNQTVRKRKVAKLGRDYEFSTRANGPRAKRDLEWTQSATFALLEAWGDRFLQHGRKSLRSDDWQEVAEKLSERLKFDVDVAQCRHRLDTLKKKYNKEKGKYEKLGSSKWIYFKKMDMLVSSPAEVQAGLACGVDGGEYVFMSPTVYLEYSNGFDEMRDSPSNSSDDGAENGADEVPPDVDDDASVRMLADSVQKFGEIYETIEASKRQQMMELEKMRMDFHRELELQRQKMIERVHAEIAKIREEDDGDGSDASENFSLI